MLSSDTAKVHVQIQTHGHIDAETIEYFRAKIQAALRPAAVPVTYAQARLSEHRKELPAPYVAQVIIDLDGRPVRAQTRASTAREAADTLEARLRARLEDITRQRRPHHRHGIPESASVAPLGTQLVRHKEVPSTVRSVDQAIDELEYMDYDFYLFVEKATGIDTVLFRSPARAYTVQQVVPAPDGLGASETAVEVDPAVPPMISTAQALDQIMITGVPFVFFRNRDSARGNVIYRRADGEFGELATAG